MPCAAASTLSSISRRSVSCSPGNRLLTVTPLLMTRRETPATYRPVRNAPYGEPEYRNRCFDCHAGDVDDATPAAIHHVRQRRWIGQWASAICVEGGDEVIAAQSVHIPMEGPRIGDQNIDWPDAETSGCPASVVMSAATAVTSTPYSANRLRCGLQCLLPRAFRTRLTPSAARLAQPRPNLGRRAYQCPTTLDSQIMT